MKNKPEQHPIVPALQDLHNNSGMQFHIGDPNKLNDYILGGKKNKQKGIPLKSLADISKIVPVVDGYIGNTYGWAKEQMNEGKCVRREVWTPDTFIWSNRSKYKALRSNGALYEPITREFIQKRYLKGFHISSHICKWTGKGIAVGWVINAADMKATDWQVYEP